MTLCCCVSRYTAMETDDKRFLHGSADYTGGEVNTTLFLVPVNHAVTSYIPGVSGVGGGSYSLANPLIPEPGRDRRVRLVGASANYYSFSDWYFKVKVQFRFSPLSFL